MNELNSLISRILVLDALDVQVVDKDGVIQQQSVQPDWTILDYNSDELLLQLEFKNLSGLELGDQISVIFWGTEFFKNYDGEEVPFGAEVRWEIIR